MAVPEYGGNGRAFVGRLPGLAEVWAGVLLVGPRVGTVLAVPVVKSSCVPELAGGVPSQARVGGSLT